MEYPINGVEVLQVVKVRNGVSETTHKPWTSVTLLLPNDCIDEFAFNGEVSVFDNFGNATSIKAGDKVSGTIVQKGNYWNLELPRKPYGQKSAYGQPANGVTKEEFNALAGRVSKVEALVFSKAALEPKADVVDDLPF